MQDTEARPLTERPDLATAHIRVHGGPLDGQLVHWPKGFFLSVPGHAGRYVAKVIGFRNVHTYEGTWEPGE